MTQFEVSHAGYLVDGVGYLGHGLDVANEAERARLQASVGEAIAPLTVDHLADCMDARLLLARGTYNDPAQLYHHVAPTVAGGTGLAATNGAVGANLEIVRGATSFDEAYDIVQEVLGEQDIEDAGHRNCGADKLQGPAMQHRLPFTMVSGSLDSVGLLAPGERGAIRQVAGNWRRRLAADPHFLAGWEPGVHEELVTRYFPHNYSEVETAGPNHGHNPRGLLTVLDAEHGYAKNRHLSRGGEQMLALTPAYFGVIANALGKTAEERALIVAALKDHTVQVGGQLFAGREYGANEHPGLAVYHATPRAS